MHVLLWIALGVVLALSPLSAEVSDSAVWPEAARLERFLETAEIVQRQRIGVGVTESIKVTLTRDGETRRAILKTVDLPDDSWRHEIAAYELDKLLGLALVPPTVRRKDKGRLGCLQLWVEGVTLDELESPLQDLDRWRRQVSAMWLFDYLTANNDRHMHNVLASSDHSLVMIDNSRAFWVYGSPLRGFNESGGATRALFWMTEYDPDVETYPTSYAPELLDRLRSLTDKRLKEALGGYVDRQGRRRLLDRRDAILETLEAAQDHDWGQAASLPR
jgi:hypothetical protein